MKKANYIFLLGALACASCKKNEQGNVSMNNSTRTAQQFSVSKSDYDQIIQGMNNHLPNLNDLVKKAWAAKEKATTSGTSLASNQQLSPGIKQILPTIPQTRV